MFGDMEKEMKIIKRFTEFNKQNTFYYKYYAITITVEDENGRSQPVFVNTENLSEHENTWININSLENEEFLKKNNIEYIIEGKEKNIIPIGLVNFNSRNNFTFHELHELNVWNQDEVNLHRANQILENIDRAIQIKYETVRFLKRFGNEYNIKEEVIEL